MSSSLSLLFTLFALSLLTTSFSDSSRKELRNKHESVLMQLRSSVYYSNRIDPSRVVQISWQPRVFLYKGFLSDKECDYLLSLAHDVKERSSGNGGHSEEDETSLDMDDDIVKRIEERISVWTFLPKENSKPLQVMSYGLGKDKRNFNFFTNKPNLELTGPLMATVILYLSSDTQGGQIVFPESVTKSSSWSNCRNSSDILQPVKGNAILFFSRNLNTSPDKSSFHTRCPVLKGEIWSAVKYFYARPISGGKVSTTSDVEECTDEDDSCAAWAAIGECQRNPVYMIGSPDYYGTCRKSCNAC
ncbi:probable prolyl 4-hydroxylase 12 isoform X1 [Trifolium pratense]|uniref:probable prolyl 4-hydroxylase 12 isoform X1 n=1 Tax=Trifolium pratense TaxID=57577 RepID=UPI001E697512|nr:probable prolyl 4-hydroxylase 12 isoform X1 [Trifolium pratense]